MQIFRNHVETKKPGHILRWGFLLSRLLTLRVLVLSLCLGLGFLRFSGAILASYFAERRLLIGGLHLKRGLGGL